MSQPREPASPGNDGGGMLDLETFEQLQAIEAAARPAEPEADPDALPTISEQRRRELKEQARRAIEERLRTRRKQRRLMRGGNL